MKVSVSQTINCAHQLPGTELHGHSYRVTVTFSGKVGLTGVAIDIRELSRSLYRTLSMVDHRQLESVIGEPATAERLAQYIQKEMEFDVSVRVQIGDDGWVETE